jgi:NAD-dependent dihydropyrimidine dehydrogenase PreA subunit
MRIIKDAFLDNDEYERMPILFCIFSKISTTIKVFEAIKKSKPKKLYVFSDCWRETKEGEKEKVEYLRKYVLDNTDWDCEILTKFQDKNLGLRYGIEAALDWFFENEEMGIVLEDDCLPAPQLFRFCSEMLIKYKDDERVCMINGSNPNAKTLSANTYFFKDDMTASDIWGWATWRRVWQNHDKTCSQYEKYRKISFNADEDSLDFNEYAKNVRMKFIVVQLEHILAGKMNTWNYQLYFSIAINDGLYIIPECNLLTNIGCSADGFTNTGSEYYLEGTLPMGEFLFPIIHPSQVSARPLTAREYASIGIPRQQIFMKELIDVEEKIISDFLNIGNFLRQIGLYNNPQIKEIYNNKEMSNLYELIANAVYFKGYYKAQKYLWLSLSKSMLKGEKNFCQNCQKRECLSFCPTKSISLQTQENEFFVKIDKSTCKFCWKCMKNCPVVNPEKTTR